MSNTIAVIPSEEQKQRDLWRRVFCKEASDDEFELFYNVCKRTGLNPEARQIYIVSRYDNLKKRNVWTPQTSIDGFRLVAGRSKQYAGQLGPYFTDDGKWSDFWFKSNFPKAAKIAVLRHDFKEPLWCVAHWDSYVQKDKNGNVGFMWKKMAEVMLAKCAEALALRKAFPQELSGLYTEEEMMQAQIAEEPLALTSGQKDETQSTPPQPQGGFVIPLQAEEQDKTKIFNKNDDDWKVWINKQLLNLKEVKNITISNEDKNFLLDELHGKDPNENYRPIIVSIINNQNIKKDPLDSF